MELRKVMEIFNYKGDMWYINPYVESGKVVRKTIYKVNKNKNHVNWECYTFESPWGKGVYYSKRRNDKPVDENTEINHGNIRVFTTRDEAKLALEEFEKQHAYDINDSVKREIARLENEKKEIEAKIALLRETGEKAFKHLSTSFSR